MVLWGSVAQSRAERRSSLYTRRKQSPIRDASPVEPSSSLKMSLAGGSCVHHLGAGGGDEIIASLLSPGFHIRFPRSGSRSGTKAPGAPRLRHGAARQGRLLIFLF